MHSSGLDSGIERKCDIVFETLQSRLLKSTETFTLANLGSEDVANNHTGFVLRPVDPQFVKLHCVPRFGLRGILHIVLVQSR